MTGKQSAEFPNMAQRAVMQYLSLDDWKVAARLPIPAGELMLSRIRNYGWIEIRGEKHHTAIKLTPAGLQAMRSAAKRQMQRGLTATLRRLLKGRCQSKQAHHGRDWI
jgi:hypothetical protein